MHHAQYNQFIYGYFSSLLPTFIYYFYARCSLRYEYLRKRFFSYVYSFAENNNMNSEKKSIRAIGWEKRKNKQAATKCISPISLESILWFRVKSTVPFMSWPTTGQVSTKENQEY